MTTDDQDDDGAPDPAGLRRLYEEASARAADAEARATAAERREVFRDAGFDLKNAAHAAMARGYDGALDGESVAAFAGQVGIGQTTPPPPQQVPDPGAGAEDQAALLRIAEAARDGGGQPPPQVNQAARDLEAQMDAAYRARDIQALDRLSVQYDKVVNVGHDTITGAKARYPDR